MKHFRNFCRLWVAIGPKKSLSQKQLLKPSSAPASSLARLWLTYVTHKKVLFGINLGLCTGMLRLIDIMSCEQEIHVKEILLFGRIERDDLVCNVMEHAQGYKFRHTSSADKALKLLEKTSPDFIMFTGNIGKNGDGSYYIEL